MEHILGTPFSPDHQLVALAESDDYLPGFPHVSLKDRNNVAKFIETELCSDILDTMSDKLWWMSKQDSGNISPLHRQIVKGRQIIISEDPKLHLVWIEDHIYIKPLPRYLLSHQFWENHLAHQNTRTYRTALGFLRTFTKLIRHESDFRIAQEPSLSLIPSHITWNCFCHWAAEVSRVQDSQVSERYRYGEIRLTRLNFYAPFLIRRSAYQRVHYQYSAYFTRFYGPILFTLAIFSLILSGFQVLGSVPEGTSGYNARAVYTAGVIVSVGFMLITIYRCRAYTADEEYRCIATENGLQAIMDCVSIEGGAEKFFCRDGRDGFESTAENYYESDYAGRRNQCFFCGLTGILKACPMDDPCFLECLCENHVTDEHLTCLATCFNIKLESPTCTNGGCSSTHRKRHAAGTTARDKWAMNDDSTRWFTADGLRIQIHYTGYFEVYQTNGVIKTSRFQLPYRDECVGTIANRCFVSPVSDEMFCWPLNVGANCNVPAPPTLAQFTKTTKISEQTKTLKDADKTPALATFEQIDVPTQKPTKKPTNEGDKNGASSCFQDNLLLVVLSMLNLFVIA
ncbi:unnamed protein product [Fusarium graminearum]|nr:unnamed protein product [Fusarium graminearum]